MILDDRLYPIKLLNKLKAKKTDAQFKCNNNIPKFIFLCGKSIKNNSQNRLLLKDYFQRYGNNKTFPLFVEDIWLNKKTITFTDLLT